MEAVALTNHDLEIEDVEYIRHGNTPSSSVYSNLPALGRSLL